MCQMPMCPWVWAFSGAVLRERRIAAQNIRVARTAVQFFVRVRINAYWSITQEPYPPQNLCTGGLFLGPSGVPISCIRECVLYSHRGEKALLHSRTYCTGCRPLFSAQPKVLTMRLVLGVYNGLPGDGACPCSRVTFASNPCTVQRKVQSIHRSSHHFGPSEGRDATTEAQLSSCRQPTGVPRLQINVRLQGPPERLDSKVSFSPGQCRHYG